MFERIDIEDIKKIAYNAVCRNHDFLILSFKDLNRREISDKIKSIKINKEKTYILLTEINEKDIKTEDFLHLYNEVFTSRVSLMIY